MLPPVPESPIHTLQANAMSIHDRIKQEFLKTPMQASAASIAVLAFFAGIFAFFLPNSLEVKHGINLRNLAICISYTLSVAFLVSIALRLLAKKYAFSAFVFSVPAVAFSNFSSIFVFLLFPPRELTPSVFLSVHDFIFYVSIITVIAVCGKAVLIDIVVDPKHPEKESDASSKVEKEDSATGGLVIAIIVLLIWCGLVSSGQKRLSETFLPEIAHYKYESKTTNR